MRWLDRIFGRAAAPVQLATLPGGVPVGSVYTTTESAQSSGKKARPWVMQWDPLDVENGAPERLVEALYAADTSGATANLQRIIDGALAKDGRLASVCRTRVNAVSARRYAVRPPPNFESDREALEVAKNVTTILNETPGFARHRAALMQAVIRGPNAGVLEHQWMVDRRGWYVSRPRYVRPWLTGIDPLTDVVTKLERGDTAPGLPLQETWPNKFIVHAPSGGLMLPASKQGAVRPILALVLAKRFGLRWWVSALERFGQPQVYGVVNAPTQTGDASGGALLDSITAGIRLLSSEWGAAFRSGVDIKGLDVSFDREAHKTFVDFVNTEYAVLLLGGNLTTESADGQVFGSQAQDRVRGDIAAADIAELDETITDQWIAPLVRFNAPGAPIPYIETTSTRARPWTVAEYQAGLCTLNDYRTSNGSDAVDGGDRYYSPAPAQSYALVAQTTPPALPSGGAAAASPFPRSTTPSGPTSPTPKRGLANALS